MTAPAQVKVALGTWKGGKMNQAEVEAFVTRLENVEQSENFGYTFFFVGGDYRSAPP